MPNEGKLGALYALPGQRALLDLFGDMQAATDCFPAPKVMSTVTTCHM